MKETYKVTITDGFTEWFNEEGKLHNPHGPAVEWPEGYKAYWLNGERHNPHGPAVEWAEGSKSYYINGEELTEEQFNNRNKLSGKEVSVTIDGVTYNAKIL